MFKKIVDFLKKLIYIVKIAKKPSFSEIRKIFYFIIFLTIFIGLLSFLFYIIGLLFLH